MTFSATDVDVWVQTIQENDQQISIHDLKPISYIKNQATLQNFEYNNQVLLNAAIVLEGDTFKEIIWHDQNQVLYKQNDHFVSSQHIYFQGLEKFQQNILPIIPFIDADNKYLGCISVQQLLNLINPLTQTDLYNCIVVKFYYKTPCLNHFLNLAISEGVELMNVQLFKYTTVSEDYYTIFCQYSNIDPLYFKNLLEHEKYEIVFQNFNTPAFTESDYNIQHLLNFLSLDATTK